jgi:hypothetical protein
VAAVGVLGSGLAGICAAAGSVTLATAAAVMAIETNVRRYKRVMSFPMGQRSMLNALKLTFPSDTIDVALQGPICREMSILSLNDQFATPS